MSLALMGRTPWNKGKLLSEDIKLKLSLAHKGRKNPKLSEALKGQPAWNKGLKGVMKPNIGSFKKGLTPWNKGKKYSEEMSLRMGEYLTSWINENGAWNKGLHGDQLPDTFLNGLANRQRNGTSIELKIKTILDEENLNFEFQKPIFGSILDFFSLDLKVGIEVQGCFYHACPICYNSETILYTLQYERQVRDRKLKKVLSQHGYLLLELWEHDINSRPNFIRSEILRVVGERKDMLNVVINGDEIIV